MSQEEVGRRWVGGVRTCFLCWLLNGPALRAEHTQLPVARTLGGEGAAHGGSGFHLGRLLAIPLPSRRQPAGPAHPLLPASCGLLRWLSSGQVISGS